MQGALQGKGYTDGVGFWVQGSGFRVHRFIGSGYKVQGFGVWGVDR